MANNEEKLDETTITISEVNTESTTSGKTEDVIDKVNEVTTVTNNVSKKSGKNGKRNQEKTDEKLKETEEKPSEEKIEEVKVETKPVVNSHRKFDVRFSYSTDSRGISGKKSWSAIEIIEQYVATPSCFIGVSTDEDLDNLKSDIKAASLKVLDKDGKKVDFSDKAKEQLLNRIEEHSNYLISKK